MKRSKIIAGGLLVLVIVAGAWWFLPPAPIPLKVATAPARPAMFLESHSSADPKSPALHPPPVAPVVAAPLKVVEDSKADSAPAATSVSFIPPDLRAALPGLASLVRSSDGFLAFTSAHLNADQLKQFIQDLGASPAYQNRIAQMSSEDLDVVWQSGLRSAVKTRLSLHPETPQIMETLARAIDSLPDQVPTLNAAGDQATFPVTLPTNAAETGHPQSITVIKINDQWYLDDSRGTDIRNFINGN